jgi:hypothetical protein
MVAKSTVGRGVCRSNWGEIASAVFLSPKSVDGVILRIYAKLGIRSRAELVDAGSRVGFIDAAETTEPPRTRCSAP